MFPENWKYFNSNFDQNTGMRFAKVSLRKAFVISIKWQDENLDVGWQESYGLTPYKFHIALTQNKDVKEEDMRWAHGNDALSIIAKINIPILQIHCHQQDYHLLHLLLNAQKEHSEIDIDLVAYNLLPGPKVGELLNINKKEMIHRFKISDELDMSNFKNVPTFYKLMYGPNTEACVSSHQITKLLFSPQKKGVFSRLLTAFF